jgi:methionyl-tRNA formyltransferase
MNSNKIAIFGCKSTTQLLMESLAGHVQIDWLITINSVMADKFEVADYTDLTQYCHENKIKMYTVTNYSLKSEKDIEFFESNQINLAFVVGWQRLVPENILSSFSIGAFGMHGSAIDLPRGRGRSPMNWAIIEGKKQFYTNLFRYDPGIDSGDVLDTYKFQITDKDTAESMHFKNTMAMIYLVMKNLPILLRGNFSLHHQRNDITPTYYPKRNPEDSLIDWEQDISVLERFIRAVAPPFNGAYSYINEINKVIILDAQIFDFSDFGFTNASVGEVVQVFPNRKFIIKCFGGLLLVNKFEGLNKLMVGHIFGNGIEIKRTFSRNNQGDFDIIE